VCYAWHTKNKRTPTDAAFTLEWLPGDGANSGTPKPHNHNALKALPGVTAEALDPEEAAIAEDLKARLRAIAEAEKAAGFDHPRGKYLGTMISILLSGGEPKEVAKTLGVTPGTVSNWRQFLRERLDA
jgi:hypothetical protein